MYTLFFKAAWQTIQQLYPKGMTGMVTTLHSWGSNLSYHPHLHCIVPQGALVGQKWVKKTGSNPYFLVNAQKLRQTFKTIFLQKFIHLIEHDIFYVEGLSINSYTIQKLRQIYHEIERKKWSVRIEKPILGVEQIIEYLARYVKRVAITNGRILAITKTHVQFEYKKYAKQKPGQAAPKDKISIEGEKFIQRFAQHILPRYFQRVRYLGLYAWTNKAKKQIAFIAIQQRPQTIYQKPNKRQLIKKMLGIDPDVCPDCACFMTLQISPLAATTQELFRFKVIWLQPAVKVKPILNPKVA
jgi:hypothetical protein